jgi:hypothetical protein
MAMRGHTTCAVNGCRNPIWGAGHLCDEHRLPGAVAGVAGDDRTFVVTCWVAEHDDEVGVIFLNDFALGDLFGGRKGFEAKLAEQGFVNVRNLATPSELEAAKMPPQGKKVGDWSGPWRAEYPWQTHCAVQFELADPVQLGFERALFGAFHQKDRCDNSTDKDAPPFCESEMDANTKCWLDKQRHEAAVVALAGLTVLELEQKDKGENRYD